MKASIKEFTESVIIIEVEEAIKKGSQVIINFNEEKQELSVEVKAPEIKTLFKKRASGKEGK